MRNFLLILAPLFFLIHGCASTPISSTKSSQTKYNNNRNIIVSAIKKTRDPRLNKQIDSTIPFLTEFLPQIACIKDRFYEHGKILPRYTTADSANQLFMVPMAPMNYHNPNTCLGVERISDWKKPAKNALSLTVLFVAEDSGESNRLYMTLIRQNDGSWLARF